MILRYFRMQGFDSNQFNLSKSILVLLQSDIDKFTINQFRIFMAGKLPYINEEGGVIFVFSSVLDYHSEAKRYESDIILEQVFDDFIKYSIENGAHLVYMGRVNNYELS